MNVKQAAKEWKVSESSVRSYCNLGFISTCNKVDGEWVIENNSLCPFIFKDKIEVNKYLISSVILKALNSNKTITSNRLSLTDDELIDYYKMLVQVGLIYRKRNAKGKDIFKKYILTPKATELIQKKNFNTHLLKYFELIFSAGISIGLKFLAKNFGFDV